MTKLSIALVAEHLLTESEELKVSYDTMKAPNGKSKTVGAPKDTSGKITKIKQVEVPTSHKGKSSKGKTVKANMGIPASDFAGNIIDGKNGVPAWSKAKNEKSPATPAVKKSKPNQTQKLSAVKGAIKRTEAGKGGNKGGIPAAKSADHYTKGLPHGNAMMQVSGKSVPEVKAPTAANLRGTTSPSHSPAKMQTRSAGTQTVSQVTHDGSKTKNPSDAPSTPTWSKAIKGHNVMESVQLVINGQPKASFDVIHRDVARKLVESYQEFGYTVELQRGGKAAWKSDKSLLKSIYEAMDAHYNNAPVSAKRASKAAMNRFFQLSTGDYNNMYESRQQFAQTLKTAFTVIMEKADVKYRQGLEVFEGISRVTANGEVMDLELITQARDTDMALRNFRNEIVEAYGFTATIKHIFVEGTKFTMNDIVEWGDSKKKIKIREDGSYEWALAQTSDTEFGDYVGAVNIILAKQYKLTPEQAGIDTETEQAYGDWIEYGDSPSDMAEYFSRTKGADGIPSDSRDDDNYYMMKK